MSQTSKLPDGIIQLLESSLYDLFSNQYQKNNEKLSLSHNHQIQTKLSSQYVGDISNSELLKRISESIDNDINQLQDLDCSTDESISQGHHSNIDSTSDQNISAEIRNDDSIENKDNLEDKILSKIERNLDLEVDDNTSSEESILNRVRGLQPSHLNLDQNNDGIASDVINEQIRISEQIDKILRRNPGLKYYDPRYYHINDETPLAIKELIYYFYWMAKIPPDCKCELSLNLCNRQGCTKYNLTKEDSLYRVLLHFGPDEVYEISELMDNGKLRSMEKVILANGSYIILTKHHLSKGNIYVSPNPHVTYPSPVPENSDELIKEQLGKMGLSNKSKFINDDRVQNAMNTDRRLQRKTIRTKTYRRLSIVMEFGPSSLIDEVKLMEYLFPSNSEDDILKMPEKLPTELPPHIKAALPPGISSKLITKVAKDDKLNNLVSSVAKGVASDLKDRQDLKSGPPRLTSDLIGAIASSTVKNVDVNKVKDVANNVGSLVNGLGLDKHNGLSAKERRIARRREARKQRKREAKLKKNNELSNNEHVLNVPYDMPSDNSNIPSDNSNIPSDNSNIPSDNSNIPSDLSYDNSNIPSDLSYDNSNAPNDIPNDIPSDNSNNDQESHPRNRKRRRPVVKNSETKVDLVL